MSYKPFTPAIEIMFSELRRVGKHGWGMTEHSNPGPNCCKVWCWPIDEYQSVTAWAATLSEALEQCLVQVEEKQKLILEENEAWWNSR